MGFYLEMRRTAGPEFAEEGVPPVFWGLYAFAGFALLCMGLAAHALLGDLARLGSGWDLAIVGTILACLPVYLLIGLKLAGIRKYIRFDGERLRVGYRLFGRTLYERCVSRAELDKIEIKNRRPAPNLAPGEHDDPQYFVRGHWLVVARLNDGRELMLDKHVEKGALAALYRDLCQWSGQRGKSPA